MSEGDMYHSKPSFRPSPSSEDVEREGEAKVGGGAERARLACTRWALLSGTSQSGRVGGTSA